MPVTLGVDVVDAAGTITSGPGGKIAQRCDAKAEGLARTVYLDPLAPPAAPGNVQLTCRPRERAQWSGTRGRTLESCMPSLGAVLTWDDRSTDEDRLNIYARLCPKSVCGEWAVGPARLRGWVPLRSVRRDTTRWLPGCTQVSRGLGTDTYGPLQLGVSAENQAGESPIVAAPLDITLFTGPLPDIVCENNEWVGAGPYR